MTDTLVASEQVADFTLTFAEAERLFRALRVAIPFASRDDSRRVLMALHVHCIDGRVTVEATDSYKLATIQLASLATEVRDFDVLIPAAWLARQLPRRAAARSEWRFEFTDHTFALHDIEEGVSATTRLIAGDYPNTSKLVPDEMSDGIQGVMGFNPVYLAAVLKAAQAWGSEVAPVKVTSLDPMKPCRFEVTTHEGRFMAVLMPVRVP